ncbi:MAG: hypothetical protein KKA10_10555 [Euryarchaeota archaeon]|nr:hypothetical protein [Euryarchaeota archaeon]MCG2738431.1 hypothetical protein [Candidatus Methanoperedenaceae archaeon]
MYEEFFETVSEHWRQILKLYKKFEDKKPIMLIWNINSFEFEGIKNALTNRKRYDE